MSAPRGASAAESAAVLSAGKERRGASGGEAERVRRLARSSSEGRTLCTETPPQPQPHSRCIVRSQCCGVCSLDQAMSASASAATAPAVEATASAVVAAASSSSSSSAAAAPAAFIRGTPASCASCGVVGHRTEMCIAHLHPHVVMSLVPGKKQRFKLHFEALALEAQQQRSKEAESSSSSSESEWLPGEGLTVVENERGQ